MRTVEKITKVLILVALFSLTPLGYAQRFWVGGQGIWSDNLHWSKTSGGIGGAPVPSKDQDVIFDKNSGLHNYDEVIINKIAFAKNIDFSRALYPVTIKGGQSANLLMTGKILGEKNLINFFNGSVIVIPSSSTGRAKKFEPGEFFWQTKF